MTEQFFEDRTELLREIQAAIELDARDLRAASRDDLVRVVYRIGEVLDRVGLKPQFVRHEE